MLGTQVESVCDTDELYTLVASDGERHEVLSNSAFLRLQISSKRASSVGMRACAVRLH